MKKKRAYLYLIIVLSILATCLIWYAVTNISKVALQHEKSSAENLPSAYSLSKEDSILIPKKILNKLNGIEVRKSKVRNPVILGFYDEKFRLAIFKIDLLSKASLKEMLKLDKEDVNQTTGVTYHVLENFNNAIWYKSGETNPISSIEATYWGDSIQTNANDSISSHYLLCKNLSIKYDPKQPIDIYLTGREMFLGRIAPFSLNILFLKRGQSVLVYILTPANKKAQLSPDMLFDFVRDIK